MGFSSQEFLVFVMKESKKRRRKQQSKLMAKSRSQPVNLPGARPLMNPLMHDNCFFPIGFLNKEIEKADIHVTDTGENPEAPQPREMIDIEVGKKVICNHLVCKCICQNISSFVRKAGVFVICHMESGNCFFFNFSNIFCHLLRNSCKIVKIK